MPQYPSPPPSADEASESSHRKPRTKSNRYSSGRSKFEDVNSSHRASHSVLAAIKSGIRQDYKHISQGPLKSPSSDGSSRSRLGSEDRNDLSYLSKSRRVYEARNDDVASTHRRSTRSSTMSSTSSRAKVPKDGVYRRRRSTATSFESSIRALTSPSLLSVLSTLTAATSSSSGSNSTVTQKSYGRSEDSDPKTRTRKERVWEDAEVLVPQEESVLVDALSIDVFSYQVQESDANIDDHIASAPMLLERSSTETTRSVDVTPLSNVQDKKDEEYKAEVKSEENDESDEDESDEATPNERHNPQLVQKNEIPSHQPFLNRVHSDSGISVGTNSSGTIDAASSADEDNVLRPKRKVSFQPLLEDDEIAQHPTTQQPPPIRYRWPRHTSSSRQKESPISTPPLTSKYPPPDQQKVTHHHNRTHDTIQSLQKPSHPLTKPSTPLLSGYELLASRLKSTPTGYPSSSPISSRATPNHLTPLYRKFEYLNHRVLLHIQDGLSQLEQRLRVLDNQIAASSIAYAANPNGSVDVRQHPDFRGADARGLPQVGDARWQRTWCLGEIQGRVKMYNETLAAFKAAMLTSCHPSHHHLSTQNDLKRDIERYRAFLVHGRGGAGKETELLIDPRETEFLNHTDDIVSLKSCDYGHDHHGHSVASPTPPLLPLLAVLVMHLARRVLGVALLWGLFSAAVIMLGVTIAMGVGWRSDDKFASYANLMDLGKVWSHRGDLAGRFWAERERIAWVGGWVLVLVFVGFG